MDDFTCPSLWHLTLSVFWVSLLGIPKTLGIWLRGYPKHGDTQITVTPRYLIQRNEQDGHFLLQALQAPGSGLLQARLPPLSRRTNLYS